MMDETDSCDIILVSIIIPVYNAAGHIEECLDSISRQNFSGTIEVILVDDCSSDASVSICRNWMQRQKQNTRLIEHERNRGASVARNHGLEEASGKYFMFVDADDKLPPQALSALFEVAESAGADVVKGNLVLFDDRSRRHAPDRVWHSRLLRGENLLCELFEHSVIRGHVGGKLLRHDKFSEIRFTVGVRMAEDLLYFSEVFAAADSLALIADVVYLYRKHGTGSTGRKYENGSYVDWLNAVEVCGKFSSSERQKRAHRKLLLLTLAQIARECRKIPAASASAVLEVIEQKCREWRLQLPNLLFVDPLGLRSISRYIKLQLALRQIRRNLSRT